MVSIKKILFGGFTTISKILPTGVKQKMYSLPVVASIFRKALNSTVEDGLSTVEITAGSLKGTLIELNMKKEKSRWLGTYEPELEQALMKYVKEGMVAYDVGANIGYVTLWFSKFVGDTGKVVSFEPLPGNAQRIRKNIFLNKINNVQLIEAAVIDQEKSVTFYEHESVGMGKAEGSAGRTDQQYKNSFEVKGICLDDLVYKQNTPKPSIIKIDIEGGEVLALPGMLRIIREEKPILMLELHGPESERVTWELLTGNGYSLYAMDNDSVKLNSIDQLKWKAYVIALPTTG